MNRGCRARVALTISTATMVWVGVSLMIVTEAGGRPPGGI
jgi:hypothetical protein